MASNTETKTITVPETVEEVMGLDDEVSEQRHIYIKHQDDAKVWKVTQAASALSKFITDIFTDTAGKESYGYSESNPIVITSIKPETIGFMIKYMEYHEGKSETPSPEFPLKDIHISRVFGDNYELFKEFCDIDLPTEKKIAYINDFCESSMYFGFTYLHESLCAITANILTNLAIDDLKKLYPESFKDIVD